MDQNSQPSGVIHSLNNSDSLKGMKTSVFLMLIGTALVLGLGVGYAPKIFLKEKSTEKVTTNAKKSAGIADKKTFKDFAEGLLKEGGIDGEGNFHLSRAGGVSQNVYLTSTTVDLSLYVGKKVKVMGETFQAEKAGWLMDVGYVEIVK